MTETERQTLINWLSDKIVTAHNRVAELQPARATAKAPDDARADLRRLQDRRSRVAAGDYAALDEARTMRIDEVDARSEASPHGPWIVYIATDDGAILISAPDDAVTSADRDATGVHRTPHVIGHGATSEAAEADARRQLPRRR